MTSVEEEQRDRWTGEDVKKKERRVLVCNDDV